MTRTLITRCLLIRTVNEWENTSYQFINLPEQKIDHTGLRRENPNRSR